MGSVEWLDQDNGIILLRFAEGDSMEQILSDYKEFAAMLASAPGSTYTIVDFLSLHSMPSRSIGHFPQFARLTPAAEKRSKVIALVSQRNFINMVTDIFARVYPDFGSRFANFSTVDEALAFIHERIREEVD